MSQQTTVVLSDGKEVTIAMLPLRAYGDLLIALEGAFKDIMSEWADVSEDQIMEMLPQFITKHLDEAAEIIAIGTRNQVTASEVADERGLADAVELAVAIIEANDVERMVSSVKKAMAAFQMRRATKAAQTAYQPAMQSNIAA